MATKYKSGDKITDSSGVVWRRTQGGHWRNDATGKLFSGKGNPVSNAAATPAAPAAPDPGALTPGEKADASAVFGKKYSPAFEGGIGLAESFLPTTQQTQALTPAEQEAINMFQQRTQVAGQEDPRIAAEIARLNQQSIEGLAAPELTAMRESALGQMNQGLATARREMQTGAAGRGVIGGASMMQAPQIMNQYEQQRRALENDILLQNLAFKKAQQDKYSSLLSERSNELWNRGQGAVSDYWTAGETGGKALRDIEKENIDRGYKRAQDVLGTGAAGAGVQITGDWADRAFKAAQEAAKSGGSVSIPGMQMPTGWGGAGNYSGTTGITAQ